MWSLGKFEYSGKRNIETSVPSLTKTEYREDVRGHKRGVSL